MSSPHTNYNRDDCQEQADKPVWSEHMEKGSLLDDSRSLETQSGFKISSQMQKSMQLPQTPQRERQREDWKMYY